jgi:prepilin-type N-terminal cleavage/methylation domain-containing protein
MKHLVDHAGQERRRSKGFTLVELIIAMAVAIVLLMVSQTAFFGVQRQRRAASAKNYFLSLVREVRTNALLLGSASGTVRVTTAGVGQTGQCPALFQDALTDGFRVGLQVNMNNIAGGWTTVLASNAQGHSVTYVSQVDRTVPLAVGGVPQLPTYVLRCKTINFPQAFRNSIIFNRQRAEGLVNNRLTITFDSRGTIDSAGPGALNDGVIVVPMREHIEGTSVGQGTDLTDSYRDENVLVLGPDLLASNIHRRRFGAGIRRCR